MWKNDEYGTKMIEEKVKLVKTINFLAKDQNVKLTVY
jgi:hypothetical protein